MTACIEVWSNRRMVKELWGREALRGKDTGKRLMDKAKKVALKHDRCAINLETQSCNFKCTK